MSSHAAGEILISLAHYRAWLSSGGSRVTAALSLGRAAHCAMLERERFDRDYVVVPDFGPQRARAANPTKGLVEVSPEEGRANKLRRQAWFAEHPKMAESYAGADKPLEIEEADRQTILSMADALARHPEAARLLSCGDPEVTVRWLCPETALRCKARIDWLVWQDDRPIAVDLKTCLRGGTRVETFGRDARKYGYRRQAAHYLDGLRALGYDPEFVFLVAEKEPPHDVGAFMLDDLAEAQGRREMRASKDALVTALETNDWHGASQGIQTITIERWES